MSIKQDEKSKEKQKANASRVVPRPDNLEGGEETEITAQVSLPNDGCYGWVVVTCAFICIAILDGVVFTFGSLMPDMTEEIQEPEALIALLNSVAVAVYFLMSPVGSAFINRFGFRTCAMTGSVVCSICLLITYFSHNYITIITFYGLIAGFGYSLINMSCILIVGFYFEKYRTIAITMATAGSSIGITCFFPLNVYLVRIGGWRIVTLLHSGLFGLIYFFAMSFRPLLSVAVVQTLDDPTRTVTYLPTLSAVNVQQTRAKSVAIVPTATERMFAAASNYNFPTAAQLVEDSQATAGPSTKPEQSKIAIKVLNPERTISRKDIQKIKSVISRASLQKKYADITEIRKAQSEKKGCCGGLCTWENHVDEDRPLYRDDAFYEGRIQKLPEYEKSRMNATNADETGLEYSLAVTRATAAEDLKDKRGIFTVGVRRVLATMLDPALLKRPSFLALCFHGFFMYCGFLVPYVYIKERNLSMGIPADHCILFVSVIGFSNIVGRLIAGGLAYKLDPHTLACFAMFGAGLSTCVSMLSFEIYYQYIYCVIFGSCAAAAITLRSILIVSLYGLEKLTNATGMLLAFQGLGSLISTPVASAIKDNIGYTVAFLVSGSSITLSGVILVPTRILLNKEKKKSKASNKS